MTMRLLTEALEPLGFTISDDLRAARLLLPERAP